MNLQEIIASRYADFVSLKDLANCISETYQCTEAEAVHVIADAIDNASEMPEFFKEGRVGPEMLDDFDSNIVYKNITSQFLTLEKELLYGIPF